MKEGYKITEIGVIPSDWQIKTIGELFEFKNGLNKEKEFFGKGTKIINYVDVYRNRSLNNNTIQGLVEVSEKENQLFNTQKGDVFFTRTSETINEIGMSAVLLEDIKDLVYSGFVLRARPKTDELDLLYKKYCFSEFYTRKEIIRKSSYTTRALTSGTLLSDVLIKIPPLTEQQKIADILSTVDEQIENTEGLIEKTKELKKGLMQRLLTKGIGHTEFKQTEVGVIPKEWKVKRLGDIGEIKSSKRVYQSDYLDAGVPFYRSKEIIELSKGKNPTIELYINKKKYNEFKEKYGAPKIRDLMITSVGTIGRTWVSDGREFYYKDGNLTQITSNPQINTKFISYYFETEILKDQYLNQSSGSAQAALTLEKLNKLIMPFPALEEQQKICDILLSVDEQISQYQAKKANLQTLKQGLMQKLLTGKVRVK